MTFTENLSESHIWLLLRLMVKESGVKKTRQDQKIIIIINQKQKPAKQIDSFAYQ